MNRTIRHLRTEPQIAIGEILEQSTNQIIARWAERAKEEQPNAQRVHHDALVDHLPQFLVQLGRALAAAGDESASQREAAEHGDQRWDHGWSVTEVVRDYQILRVVMAEFLEERLGRRLEPREALVLNVAIDDAIAISVAAFVACQSSPGVSPNTTRNEALDLLFNVLGTIGHELRNPLAPLTSSLEVLRLAGSNAAIIEDTRKLMERQLRVLRRLVEDLMDLPRLARGKMSITLEKIDLAQLVRTCAEDRRKGFVAGGITLEVDVPSVSVGVLGDETRLTQAFGNLLGNAQKFTDSGGTVTVRMIIHPKNGAITTISDTGIGIDAAVLPKVFEAYIQADHSVGRSRGGMGLGLALVKGVVELHGGAVRASSPGLGKGAVFTVELPLSESAGPAKWIAGDHRPPPGKPHRILVIEDNKDSAESLQLYLELHGHTVSVAYSGPDGIAAAKTLLPSVVICDVGLPGMDGYAVAAELRQVVASPMLIVAVTGHGARMNLEGVPDKVFDYYLLKPANLEHLAQILSAEPTSLR